MAKKKTVYFCNNCGAESAKWIGKCPSCGEWNTYVEEIISSTPTHSVHGKKGSAAVPELLKDIEQSTVFRIGTQDQEFDRVLGGGIVPGSLILLGGEPGIGKSTLLLQVALSLSAKKILYVSGEESSGQIKMRADRMDIMNEGLYLLSETNLENIFNQVSAVGPELVIVDSIQTVYSENIESAPGSVSQVRHCTGELMKYAKKSQVPVLLIGHITKDGTIAGPKLLEHMVDTVVQFEGDRHLSYRILRTSKNRFGSTSELGIYEMRGNGLRQVSNPSEILISQRDHIVSGVTIGAALEGNRPLNIEVQSLVTQATYGNPQRSSTGYDLKRMNMLLAVLEKRAGFKLASQDVFLNIAGGIKIDDPAIDLAVCMSIISSLEDMAISDKIAFAGEIGLGGEVRAVQRIESRISEAEKLGFQEVVISKYNLKGLDINKFSIKIKAKSRLVEVISDLLG